MTGSRAGEVVGRSALSWGGLDCAKMRTKDFATRRNVEDMYSDEGYPYHRVSQENEGKGKFTTRQRKQEPRWSRPLPSRDGSMELKWSSNEA